MISITHKKINKVAGICSVLLAFIFLFLTPLYVNAQTAIPTGTSEFSAPINSTYTLLTPLPCIAGTGNNCTAGSSVTSVNIQTYIIYIFKLMVALAVLAAVVMCIIGGFQYMLSDSVTKKSDAKKTIENAVLGLAGALLSYLILYTISPNLVNVSLVTVPKLNVATTNINTSAANVPPCDINCQTDTQVAAMAAAGVAQDNALAQQVAADKANEDNLGNQFNACTPTDSAACEALYDQYIAAQDKTDADMAANATTYADNNYNVQVANEAKETTAGQVLQDATNIQNEEINALGDCPNGDLDCQQQVRDDANVALFYTQNQANILNFENDYATKSSSDALSAGQALELQIQQSTTAEITNNPNNADELQANEKAQVQAVQQWVAKHNNP